RGSSNPRYVPAEVKRTVIERDQGQCTFVAPSGHRCEARAGLEFDHVTPVASGGKAVAANLRLRCRAHNQLEAEPRFGRELMSARREQARQRRAEKRASAEAQRRASERARAREAVAVAAASGVEAAQLEVVPWLRQLGFSAAEARRGAANCSQVPGES